MPPPLNIAITNATESARTIHLPLINAVPDLEYIATSSLDHPNIQIILNTTPLATRFSTTQKALQAGKYVLTEVPLSPTAAETAKLIALARQKGVLLCPMFRHRYDGDYNTLAKLRKEGRLGEWREWEVEGGDLVRRVDQVHHFFGMPESVRKLKAGGLRLEYSGLVVKIDLRPAVRDGDQMKQFIVRGEKGGYEKAFADPQLAQLEKGLSPNDEGFGVEPASHHGSLIISGEAAEVYLTIRTPTWKGLYVDFALAVRGRHHNPCAPEGALAGQRIVESAIRGGK